MCKDEKNKQSLQNGWIMKIHYLSSETMYKGKNMNHQPSDLIYIYSNTL